MKQVLTHPSVLLAGAYLVYAVARMIWYMVT